MANAHDARRLTNYLQHTQNYIDSLLRQVQEEKMVEGFDDNMRVALCHAMRTLKDNTLNSVRKNTKAKRKDKNAPKRPRSSYIYFHSDPEVRKRIKEEHPNAAGTEITSLISKEFKKLQEKDKQYYDNKAKDDKIRYAREMTEYSQSDAEPQVEEKKVETVEEKKAEEVPKIRRRRTTVKTKN